MHISKISTILTQYWIVSVPGLLLVAVLSKLGFGLWIQVAGFVTLHAAACTITALVIHRTAGIKEWLAEPQEFLGNSRLLLFLIGVPFLAVAVMGVFAERGEGLTRFHQGVLVSIFAALGGGCIWSSLCARMELTPLHLTSGDIAGDNLTQAGLPGEVFVWHDILYDGPRRPAGEVGCPDDETLIARAAFLEETTGGGLDRAKILETLRGQYQRLGEAALNERIVLWFDACLFDQSMLAHILACLAYEGVPEAELLCVDAFPGIEPFNGLGQLRPDQLASLYADRCPVTEEQFEFAAVVDKAFATQDTALLTELSEMTAAPLPWVPAAAARWLQERPDPKTGLGRLESLALAAIRSGCETPGKIFASVAAADTPPQFWGDTTLWAKINGLADRVPPLVRIEGPADRLPQWESSLTLEEFRITPANGPKRT